MASLARCCQSLVRPLLLRNAVNVAPVSCTYATAWNKDWEPGPYPKTAKERAAAAKKYGLLPEDYEPYPDDGMGYGDYPKLPEVPVVRRPTDQRYDQPYLRRNFGEPMPVEYDAIREDWLDPDLPKHMHAGSTKYMVAWFSVVVGIIIAGILLVEPYPFRLNVMPKQFPSDGKTHYTFEPAE